MGPPVRLTGLSPLLCRLGPILTLSKAPTNFSRLLARCLATTATTATAGRAGRAGTGATGAAAAAAAAASTGGVGAAVVGAFLQGGGGEDFVDFTGGIADGCVARGLGSSSSANLLLSGSRTVGTGAETGVEAGTGAGGGLDGCPKSIFM